MSEPPPILAVMPESTSLSSISLNDDSPMCRICHNTADTSEPLQRVCMCKGTMGQVHKSCLQTWLSTTHSDVCPVCHYQFRTAHVYKPIRQWRCPSMDGEDIATIGFTVIFVGLTLVQLSLILVLASYYKGSARCHVTISMGIAGIACSLPFFFAVSIILALNMILDPYWSEWRKANKQVVVYIDDINIDVDVGV